MHECNHFAYAPPAVHISGTRTAGLGETEPGPIWTHAQATAMSFSKTITESIQSSLVNLGNKRSA